VLKIADFGTPHLNLFLFFTAIVQLTVTAPWWGGLGRGREESRGAAPQEDNVPVRMGAAGP
jgi:hypothetical protein